MRNDITIYGILKIQYPHNLSIIKGHMSSYIESTSVRKMVAFDNFKNCSNLTDEQIEVMALVRGVSAAVCCAISSTVLVVFVILATLPKTRNRVCGTVVKRLSFELIAISVLCQLNHALQLVNYYHYDENYCKANGFFSQYINTVELIFVLGISLALFFKISLAVIPSWRSFLEKAKEKAFTCHNTKLTKPELATVVLMIFLPLLFDWIPFTTNTYGQYATWCWIRILDQNCTTNTAGWWEQIWLWNVPFGIASFVILVLFVGSLCQLRYGIKKVHNYKLIEVGIIEYLLLLVFLVFASCLVFLIFAFSFQGETIDHSFTPNQIHFVYWIFFAVSSPFIGTFSPLALLFTIHIPISATCKQHQHYKRESRVHREEDLKTINKSDAIEIPSYTTWDPPHSSFDDVPFVQID